MISCPKSSQEVLVQEEAPNCAGGNESLCKLQEIPDKVLRIYEEAEGSPQWPPVVGCLMKSMWLLSSSHYILFLQKTNKDVGLCMDSSLARYLLRG